MWLENVQLKCITYFIDKIRSILCIRSILSVKRRYWVQ